MKSTDTYFKEASRLMSDTTFISYQEKKNLAAEIGVDNESLSIDRIDRAIIDKLECDPEYIRSRYEFKKKSMPKIQSVLEKLWDLELEVLRLMASGVRSETLECIAQDVRTGWLGLSSEAGSVDADFAFDILAICSKNIESTDGLPEEIVRKIRERRK